MKSQEDSLLNQTYYYYRKTLRFAGALDDCLDNASDDGDDNEQ